MIKFETVSKKFKKRTVISNFNLEIADGQLVALIGASGCGKTTTLKMINRLIEPSAGRILLNGKNIADVNIIKLRRNMGYVIQQTGLFPHMTIRANIEIIPKVEHRPAAEIAARTLELMQMVGMEPYEFLDRYPSQLSGGQQQRIGVARAFAADPAVVLMDEPFSALDPLTRISLQDELTELHSHLKKTIVFVTHDMDEAIKIADMICVMNEGQILQYDTPENILKNPCNDFVSNFVGKNRIWASPEFIRIADIMIEDPVYCRPNMSLLQCMERMRSFKVDTLMVVENKTLKLLGMVKAKEIQRQKDRSQPVSAIMQREFYSVCPEDNLVELLRGVEDENISNVPVLSGDSVLRGLITKSSLLTTLSQSILEPEEVPA